MNSDLRSALTKLGGVGPTRRLRERRCPAERPADPGTGCGSVPGIAGAARSARGTDTDRGTVDGASCGARAPVAPNSCPPQATEIAWRIDNLATGTSSEGIVNQNLPGASNSMQAGFNLGTLNAVARNVRAQKFYVEVPR